MKVLVTIATYRDANDAYLAVSLLESAGIECVLLDENASRMYGLFSPIIGGVKVQVSPDDEQGAREILAAPAPPPSNTATNDLD